MGIVLKQSDYDLLHDVHKHGVVHFDWEPAPPPRRHAILVHATLGESTRHRLHELAVAGYVAESVGAVNDGRDLPLTRTAYALTALGRHVCGIRKPTPPRTRAGTAEVLGASWEE